MYVDLKTNLVELLMKQDRMTMAASVESRVPFLDHAVVEFAARAPQVGGPRDLSGKRLLKRMARPLLPAAVVSRRKQGFPVPFDSWLRTEFFANVRRVLMADNGFARRWFQPAKLEGLLEAHRTGRYNYSRQIWSLLSLELWGRIFLHGEQEWLEAPEEAWQFETQARRPGGARTQFAASFIP
jgi:asparagine synthase (glutamine-hydrolysing)